MRAFDQSLAANRAHVLWLRSDRVEDTEDWRLSRRASVTKARLMARFAEAGFVNLPEEWWHYTLADEPFPETFFDAPIT